MCSPPARGDGAPRAGGDGHFLHCEGGAATQYAKPCSGGGTTGGAEIEPLDEEAALDWCEEHGIDGKIVVDEFGHLIET